MNKINLTNRFREELCTFEMSKKAKIAGATCANTYFAYDNMGNVTSGGWLEGIGYDNFYPCISFPFACVMLEDTDLDHKNVDLYEGDGSYTLKYKTEAYTSKNIVDVLLEIWLKHKK